jgi:hypothetical protein
MLECLEHVVSAYGADGEATAAGGVAERVSEECLPDAGRAHDGRVGVCLDEAEREELVEERAIIGDACGRVPCLDLHGRVETRALGAQGGRIRITAGCLVAEDEEQEVLVGDLLLPSKGEALRKRVRDARQLESSQHRAEVGREGVGRGHHSSPS